MLNNKRVISFAKQTVIFCYRKVILYLPWSYINEISLHPRRNITLCISLAALAANITAACAIPIANTATEGFLLLHNFQEKDKYQRYDII